MIVFFGVITSSISLMETIISIIRDKLGWSRGKAYIIVFICSLIAPVFIIGILLFSILEVLGVVKV